MKKLIFVLVLVVILVMSLTGLARAEMRVVGYSAEKMIGLPGTELEEVLGEHYYLDVKTDRTDETKRIEVDYDTYEMYRNELEAEKAHHENLWYVKAGSWCVGAFNDAVDWEALDKIKRTPGITPDPCLQAWYAQLGKERMVAQRVFELIDIYRMTDDEKTCVLNCLKYHSNRQNLYPIKGNRG